MSDKTFQGGPVLGIETSCDETAAAIVEADGRVLSNVIYSQHDLHGRYGGIVPELASRRHIQTAELAVREALAGAGMTWSDLTAVAVTQGPGLAGALLVGVCFAKALAYSLRIPLIGVSHLEGHVASGWIDDPGFPTPCITLVVSGGHTHLYLIEVNGSCKLLGRTLDDAAGEAFDKGAQMLSLKYPGGPEIDKLARTGNPNAIQFPRAYLHKQNLNFSFSGLKTALLYHLDDLKQDERTQSAADIAASFQEAIVEVLIAKALDAVRRFKVRALAVVGGVSANSRLRTLLKTRTTERGIRLSLPPLSYCTDNAAMIAIAGRRALIQGRRSTWTMEAEAELAFPIR